MVIADLSWFQMLDLQPWMAERRNARALPDRTVQEPVKQAHGLTRPRAVGIDPRSSTRLPVTPLLST
jgi:hypothetical protein